jgi:hypothetical protein
MVEPKRKPDDKPRCNCGILGTPDRQCSRRAALGTLCAQHAKMDRQGNRVFRWEWEDGKLCVL